MNGFTLFSASIFSGGQIATIVVISVVVALLIALNVVIWYLYRKHYVRRLCSKQLEVKRDELNERLAALKAGTLDLSAVRAELAAASQTDEKEEEEDEPEAQTDEDEAADDSDGDDGSEGGAAAEAADAADGNGY